MYDYIKGVERIDNILNNNEGFEELDYIPSSERLTHKNGFYVSCSSIFIDIRKSSNLTDSHTRPVLSKLYRAFISEAIAALQSISTCSRIEIQGDCVSGIFNTTTKKDIGELFDVSAQIVSMINILNYKFSKKNITNIAAGIGISYGRALMIKAGLKGSGENGVVWIGDVVNKASKLSGGYNKINMCGAVYNNLTDENKKFCTLQWSQLLESYYVAAVCNTSMQNWLNAQEAAQNNLSSLLGYSARRTLLGA